MPDFRADDPAGPVGGTVYVEQRKSRAGAIIAGVVIVALAVIVLLFATGFWSAKVHGGEMPQVKVSAKGGELPDVSMHSKEVVVGTTKTSVDVPKVETKKTTVDVPTVGVSDKKD